VAASKWLHRSGCIEGDVGERAHAIDGQEQVELAFRQAQLAVVDVDVADLCLGKALALGGRLFGFGQPSDAVPNQAAVERAAGQRRDARAQAAQNIIERQQGAGRNSTMMASSASVRVVLRGRLGPIGWSAVVVRLRHFWTVVGFSP
jgi:hypothetical protein